jgi:hypothetical protein
MLGLATPVTADIIPPVDYHAYITAEGLNSNDWQVVTNTLGVTDVPTINPVEIQNVLTYVINVQNVSKPAPWYKQFWFEIDWVSPTGLIPPDAELNTITARTADGYRVVADGWSKNANTNSVTWQWTITPQPAYEEVLVPAALMAVYGPNVARIDVASRCVPEPTTVISLVSGLVAVGLVCLRRARR